MSLCINNVPTGLNAECAKAMGRINNIILQDYSDTAFDTQLDESDLITDISTWAGKLATKSAITMWMPDGISNAEDTSNGIREVTTAMGDTYIAGEDAPKMTAYVKVAPCDMQMLKKALTGGKYRVWLVGDGNYALGYKTSTLTVQGFTANVYAKKGGLPISDEAGTAIYELRINFEKVEEFASMEIFSPSNWSFNTDLPAYKPVGYTLEAVTSNPSVASATDVRITFCGELVTDLDETDMVISGNTLTSLTYDAATGLYTPVFGAATACTLEVAVGTIDVTAVSNVVNYAV